MVRPSTALEGIALAMENEVSALTESLDREADEADNMVEFPHGEIIVMTNARSDDWNTEFVEYSTGDLGDPLGEIIEVRFDPTLQLNIWLGVPSENWDIQNLGNQLYRGMLKYDYNRRHPKNFPDPDGGELTDIKNFNVTDGGTLPTEDEAPPMRGYMVEASLRTVDRIDTSDDGDLDGEYFIESTDTPHSGDFVGGSTGNVTIEYQA
jgi:hypothetical protein